MNFINRIIADGNETIIFKTSENSLVELARQFMFYNKGKQFISLHGISRKEKSLIQKISGLEKFSSCSFEEVFDKFKPRQSLKEVKLSDFKIDNSSIKLTNRVKGNSTKLLISFSNYQIGPLSNSLYPRDNTFLRHQPLKHYRYQRQIPIKNKFSNKTKLVMSIIKIKLISGIILNKRKGISNYEFL